MQNPISVGVPVRNESATIKNTINSILSQNTNLEIIVCANACTDEGETEKIVSELTACDKRIKLIRSKPGKPNAWNKIIDEANYDEVLFVDGDVVVGNNSVVRLIDFMNFHKYIASSSKRKKIIKSKNPLEWMLNYPIYQSALYGITGCMYSIKRKEFLAEMNLMGFKKMPHDLICEDTWITLILEKRKNGKILERKWGYCNDAVVCYQPPNRYDRFERAISMATGSIQLSLEYPELGHMTTAGRTLKERFLRRLSQWKTYGLREKVTVPINFIVSRMKYEYIENFLAMKIAEKIYQEGKHTNLWAEPLSTKQQISNEVYSELVS